MSGIEERAIEIARKAADEIIEWIAGPVPWREWERKDMADRILAAIQEAKMQSMPLPRVAELEQIRRDCITGLERAQLWIDEESAIDPCTCGTSEHCSYCAHGEAASGAVARALDAANSYDRQIPDLP